MAMFGRRLAGAGYVVLNVIRVMNIISLLAVMAASSVMLVKTFNNNTFFFFDACEHVIRIAICGLSFSTSFLKSANGLSGFLILTELPLFKQYFARTWPLFSPSSGFVMLGASMLLVGNSTLANLNKDEASQDKLGLAFWRLVIGSGIVVIVMGSVNILAVSVVQNTSDPRMFCANRPLELRLPGHYPGSHSPSGAGRRCHSIPQGRSRFLRRSLYSETVPPFPISIFLPSHRCRK